MNIKQILYQGIVTTANEIAVRDPELGSRAQLKVASLVLADQKTLQQAAEDLLLIAKNLK